MTGYKRGDVVLVRFIFSDETGERQRPAVIVSSEEYHKSRQEAIIAAVTSRTDRILAGDHLSAIGRKLGCFSPPLPQES
jgi:mRNA-degrading endonuclease toxin of MazEF toxin-antitoxin module